MNKKIRERILELSFESYKLKRDSMKPCCVKIKDALLQESAKIDYDIKCLMADNQIKRGV